MHNFKNARSDFGNLFCLPPLSAGLPQFLGAVSLASLGLCLHADVWMCNSVLG